MKSAITIQVITLGLMFSPAMAFAQGTLLMEDETVIKQTPVAPAPAPAWQGPPVPANLPKKPTKPKLGADTNQLFVNSVDGIYLRPSPGYKNKPLGIIKDKTALDPTGRESADGRWKEVEIKGRKGWIDAENVTEAEWCEDGVSCGGRQEIKKDTGGFTLLRDIAKFVGIEKAEAQEDSGRGPLSYAAQIQRNMRIGLRAGRNKCWRAVWEILKKTGMVKGELTQNSAKNALIDLGKHGFRHDPAACNRPGVVRVYDGTSVRVGKRYRTAGDTHGHIEILGTDGRFHHFTNSKNSIQARFGKARRPLKYCLVK